MAPPVGWDLNSKTAAELRAHIVRDNADKEARDTRRRLENVFLSKFQAWPGEGRQLDSLQMSILPDIIDEAFFSRLLTWHNRVELKVDFIWSARTPPRRGVTLVISQDPKRVVIWITGVLDSNGRQIRRPSGSAMLRTLLHECCHAYITLYWKDNEAERKEVQGPDGLGHGALWKRIFDYTRHKMSGWHPDLEHIGRARYLPIE